MMAQKILTCLTIDDIHPVVTDIQKLNQLFDLLRRYKLKSTIFIAPFYYRKNIGDYKQYVNLLKNYLDEGNEIGLHGFEHKKHEFGYSVKLPFPLFDTQVKKLKKSTKLLENALQTKIYGFRAPCYQHNNNTIKALSELKFSYDSSKTVFKPTHIPKYNIRLRTSTLPKPYIIKDNLVEIPVVGDYTNSQNNFEKSLDDDIKFVSEQDGVFVINSHIQFGPISEYAKFLEVLGRYDNLKFYSLIDICKMYM